MTPIQIYPTLPYIFYSSDVINEGYNIRHKKKENGNNACLYEIKSFLSARNIFTLHSPPLAKNLEGFSRVKAIWINILLFQKQFCNLNKVQIW